MIEVVGIKFTDDEKIYYYNPSKLQMEKGEKCLVEVPEGVKEGEVVLANFFIEPDKIIAPLRRIIQYVSDRKEIFEQKKGHMEKKAWDFCNKRIQARNLPMKLIHVEYTEDLKKVIFYFVAEKRVDFRELLKDLVKTLRVKIELRQVSRREYAKKIGGIGICGRECCCKNHLKAFSPITIKMAKIQGMPLNPSKISGICGRLLCCLAYERYDKPVTPIYQETEEITEDIEAVLEDNNEKTTVQEADVDWGQE
ncbi:MAG: stage 0 sporulation protein [Candidatus Goldbacteria bacterium]|nr:stage 0 sporulation protein [Candidatus Goldiibacteriota bacterium]